MSDALITTVSVAHRTISVQLEDGRTIRYALSRTPAGDVYWREDEFAAYDDPLGAQRWLRHRGPLSVAEVIAAVPTGAREVRTLTGLELDAGPVVDDLDVFGQQRRAEALTRLRRELQTLDESRAA